MKGQIVFQINDDNTVLIQSTKPKNPEVPMLAHYTFPNVAAAIEKIKSEAESMITSGNIAVLGRN